MSIKNPWIPSSQEIPQVSEQTPRRATADIGEIHLIISQQTTQDPALGTTLNNLPRGSRSHKGRFIASAVIFSSLTVGAIILKKDEIKDWINKDSAQKTQSMPPTGDVPVVTRKFVGESVYNETGTIVTSGCAPVLNSVNGVYAEDGVKDICWELGEIVPGRRNGQQQSLGVITLTAQNIYGPLSDDALGNLFIEGEITKTELGAFIATNVIDPLSNTQLIALNSLGDQYTDSTGEQLSVSIKGGS